MLWFDPPSQPPCTPGAPGAVPSPSITPPVPPTSVTAAVRTCHWPLATGQWPPVAPSPYQLSIPITVPTPPPFLQSGSGVRVLLLLPRLRLTATLLITGPLTCRPSVLSHLHLHLLQLLHLHPHLWSSAVCFPPPALPLLPPFPVLLFLLVRVLVFVLSHLVIVANSPRFPRTPQDTAHSRRSSDPSCT